MNQFLEANSHGFVAIWVDDEDVQRSGAWMLCHCLGWDRELSSSHCERCKAVNLNLYTKPWNRVANSEVGISIRYWYSYRTYGVNNQMISDRTTGGTKSRRGIRDASGELQNDGEEI